MTTNSNSIESPPKDRYNVIYMICFLLGVSGHLPWNTILTAQPYFYARLLGSSIGSEFTAHFAIIFKAIKLAVFAFVSLTGRKINNKLWIAVGSIGNVLVFSVLAGMVDESMKKLSTTMFYLITISLVTAAGTFLALFECGMYSILGPFPSHLTQSFLAGNSLGGIMAALNLIISYYSISIQSKNFHDYTDTSTKIFGTTRVYFILSTVIFILAFLSFIIFLCTDYCQFYQKRLALYTVISTSSNHPVEENTCKLSDSQVLEKDSFNHSNNIQTSEESTILKPTQGTRKNHFNSFKCFKCFKCFNLFNFLQLQQQRDDLMKRLWSYNFSLFFIGFVNLTIFPAIVSVTQSTHATLPTATPFQRELFVPLAFLIVGSADFIGKILPSWRRVFYHENLPFSTLSLGRFLLIPMFLVGNIKINGHGLIFPTVFASDWVFFSLLIVAFITAGYFSTMIMVSAPKTVDIAEQSRAIVLLCTAVQLGVFGGSVFSLFLKLGLKLFLK